MAVASNPVVRWFLATIAVVIMAGCASNGTTIGDLLGGGPSPLQGDPARTGLVLVDVKLMPPEGEMFDGVSGLSAAYPVLQNIHDNTTINYTDERYGHILFSDVPAGEYRFVMQNVTRYTFDSDQYYDKKRDRNRQNYNYRAGEVWQDIIIVKTGEPVYRGQIVITPESAEIFEIGIGDAFSDDETPEPISQVQLKTDSAAEKDSWKNYFLKVYRNSVWGPRVQSYLVTIE
ncbi:hypothetical protein [Alteromonas lipolytica]|uniref:Uncharacterized protein n=1 Tax=Alteromonas lipolytica TaxID=1856405 RepID=A0A1E8FG51_9ALTE|nr:hypothetical protein [Alteromonas lipolytica]OFI34716.1 hypothetical protein BFC17_14140 [Alteromonas lipolytica]GGF53439.1 hypothetical protein GCM10011338_01950 [Alteromonas lipolytica]